MPRNGRRKLFDKPGKALMWGLAGCLACSALGLSFGTTILITIGATLAGCFNG
jgi:hypothetical protein